MRAVDTNVLVRLITRDDLVQVAIADRFVEDGAWVSHIVLVEAAWVLDSVYDLASAEIATAIEMLLDHRQLSVEEPDVVRAAVAQLRTTARLGFSDCMVLETARRAGHLPLGSFDRKLGRLEGVTTLSR